MVSRFTIPALAALAVLTASPAVHAADMPMPAPIAVPETTGWYLRGDIGFSNQEVGSLFNENYAGYDLVREYLQKLRRLTILWAGRWLFG